MRFYKMKSQQVSIIILNWNRCSDTLECLESVKKSDYDNYRIIVVDNASTDGSQEAIEKQFPDAALIKNKENLGFTGGNNAGIRYALEHHTDYVFLLNNDTIVSENMLSELVRAAEGDPRVGIAGPKMYYYSKPKVIWFAGGELDWLEGASHIGMNEVDRGQYDEVREVDFITGCGLLIKRNVIDTVGMLREDFFIYYEDVDLCLRARNAGFKCIYVPSSSIWHKVGATTGKRSAKITEMQLYLGTRNKIISVKTNYSLFAYLWFLLKQTVVFSSAYIAVLIMRKDFDLLWAYIHGLSDGIRGVTPMRIKP